MELHYDITKQDYIDFNLNYYVNNAVVQRSILMTRIMTAVLVLAGGTALMYFVHGLSVFSVAVYVALAAVCFFGTPWYMKRKVVKNTERILRNAKNKQLCGPKTLTLREDEFELCPRFRPQAQTHLRAARASWARRAACFWHCAGRARRS